MTIFPLRRPRLPRHYYVQVEPPDSSGEEVLIFSSERRRITLKGHSFREFYNYVIPLLDGTRTIEEIQATVNDIFAPQDLAQGLQLLADHQLLDDAANDTLPRAYRDRLAPQLNFFYELSLDPDQVQHRLMNATVSVVGLGGAGISAALSLAAAQLGTIRCIDPFPVAATDPILAPAFATDVGIARAEAASRMISAIAPNTKVSVHTGLPDTDEDVLALVDGSDFVVCCADQGMSSLFFKLNRVCLKTNLRWTSGAVSALEGVVGPTVVPHETPCYMCYTMRSVAASDNPEAALAFQQFLDRRKRDDSDRRENQPFGSAIIGNMLGLEALKVLTGAFVPSALGRVVVVDFMNLQTQKHMVLRKPWCPACFAPIPNDHR